MSHSAPPRSYLLPDLFQISRHWDTGDVEIYYPWDMDIWYVFKQFCNEHGTIYAISSDFGDRMIMQSMGLMVLLSEHF